MPTNVTRTSKKPRNAPSPEKAEVVLHELLARYERRLQDLQNNPPKTKERLIAKEESLLVSLADSLSPLLAFVPTVGPALAAAAPGVARLVDEVVKLF
jgi:hypothetical protein